MQAAAKLDFHMNKALNGIPLPPNIHVEGMVHSDYNTQIGIELQKIITRKGSNISPADAKEELELLISKIRTWIDNNPGVNLNTISF